MVGRREGKKVALVFSPRTPKMRRKLVEKSSIWANQNAHVHSAHGCCSCRLFFFFVGILAFFFFFFFQFLFLLGIFLAICFFFLFFYFTFFFGFSCTSQWFFFFSSSFGLCYLKKKLKCPTSFSILWFFFSTKQIKFSFLHFSILPIKYIWKKTKFLLSSYFLFSTHFLSFHFSTPPIKWTLNL